MTMERVKYHRFSNNDGIGECVVFVDLEDDTPAVDYVPCGQGWSIDATCETEVDIGFPIGHVMYKSEM